MNINANVDKRAVYAFHNNLRAFSFTPPQEKKSFVFRHTSQSGEWQMQYDVDKRWLSRIYKLKLTYSFPLQSNEGSEGNWKWNIAKRNWEALNSDHAFEKMLNETKDLTALLQNVDFEWVRLEVVDGQVKLTAVLVPGCFVWTLIPPMHYFVRLKEAEVITLKHITKVLETAFHQSELVS